MELVYGHALVCTIRFNLCTVDDSSPHFHLLEELLSQLPHTLFLFIAGDQLVVWGEHEFHLDGVYLCKCMV